MFKSSSCTTFSYSFNGKCPYTFHFHILLFFFHVRRLLVCKCWVVKLRSTWISNWQLRIPCDSRAWDPHHVTWKSRNKTGLNSSSWQCQYQWCTSDKNCYVTLVLYTKRSDNLLMPILCGALTFYMQSYLLSKLGITRPVMQIWHDYIFCSLSSLVLISPRQFIKEKSSSLLLLFNKIFRNNHGSQFRLHSILSKEFCCLLLSKFGREGSVQFLISQHNHHIQTLIIGLYINILQILGDISLWWYEAIYVMKWFCNK